MAVHFPVSVITGFPRSTNPYLNLQGKIPERNAAFLERVHQWSIYFRSIEVKDQPGCLFEFGPRYREIIDSFEADPEKFSDPLVSEPDAIKFYESIDFKRCLLAANDSTNPESRFPLPQFSPLITAEIFSGQLRKLNPATSSFIFLVSLAEFQDFRNECQKTANYLIEFVGATEAADFLKQNFVVNPDIAIRFALQDFCSYAPKHISGDLPDLNLPASSIKDGFEMALKKAIDPVQRSLEEEQHTFARVLIITSLDLLGAATAQALNRLVPKPQQIQIVKSGLAAFKILASAGQTFDLVVINLADEIFLSNSPHPENLGIKLAEEIRAGLTPTRLQSLIEKKEGK